ncbi:ACT domain-containing protein [Hydrogenophaga taeniospiralis]|uniref:ACT domain-containing protein n=1 Tax=Hydrogenophaga taeniospiralis TaxID=65656 RepID=UPI001CFBB786|nr:ACT domain-containing protein [Hydrogenophaga taeniospiralis]MCB4365450.1 ACT domain-containing protein [Hydrogenophaga taeniospiralis]
MSGEKNQIRLQQMMAPDLRPETYVYCTFPDQRLPIGLDPICTFREAEGLTAIVEQSQAVRANVKHIFEAKLITLTVHSSLEAIGFLAMISTHLAKAGIPCNAVAAYHHDHLFIPVDRADDAFSLLESLSQSSPHAVA